MPGRYRIEINFAGSGNDVWRKTEGVADNVGRRAYMKEGKVVDGKGGAEHLQSNTERLARFTPEERADLERGVGVHSGSAGKIGSSDVLKGAYAYGHESPEEQARALDPNKVHRVQGANGRSIQLKGHNVFYGQRSESDTQVVDYSVGGPKTVDGSDVGGIGGVGSMEEQAGFMLVEVNQRIQQALRENPDADIDIDVRGHSRGGVSAAILERDLKALYHDNPHVHFRGLQLDPVPGGVMALNDGFEQHFDPSQGAVHPHLVKALRDAPDFVQGSPRDGVEVDGQIVPIVPGQPRPGDRHAVVYSVDPEGLDKAFFTPQEVMGADVMVITPENHDLYQKRAQVRDGQFGIGGYEAEIDGQWQHIGGADLANKLPKGVYVAVPTEQGMMLIPAPPLGEGPHSPETLQRAADDIIAAAGGTPSSMNQASNRQEVLRQSIMKALDPSYTGGAYVDRAQDESPNFVNGRNAGGHVQRKSVKISKVEAKEQARWAKDIVKHQKAEMEAQQPGSSSKPEAKVQLKQLEGMLKQPENRAVARDMHMQYREQDFAAQALAAGATPAGLNAQALAPSATTPSEAPSFWQGVKQRFTNLFNRGSFSTDQQLQEQAQTQPQEQVAVETELEDLSPFAVEEADMGALGLGIEPSSEYEEAFDAREVSAEEVQFMDGPYATEPDPDAAGVGAL